MCLMSMYISWFPFDFFFFGLIRAGQNTRMNTYNIKLTKVAIITNKIA